MTQPVAGTELVFTPEEFADEIGLRVSFVKHLVGRDAFTLRVIDGQYHLTADELATIKADRQRAQDELHYAFTHQDEIRRRLIARAVGVDEETAKRLGY